MGSGIQQVAAFELLQRLPVPSAGEPVECNADLHDAAHDAGTDHPLYLLKMRRVSRLLERREDPARPLGRRHHAPEVLSAGCHGFFTHDMMSRVERFLCGLRMDMAGQRVDHQVNVISRQHIPVVRVRIAFELTYSAVATVPQQIRHGRNPVFRRGPGQPLRVNIPTAASLAQNADPHTPASCHLSNLQK